MYTHKCAYLSIQEFQGEMKALRLQLRRIGEAPGAAYNIT